MERSETIGVKEMITSVGKGRTIQMSGAVILPHIGCMMHISSLMASGKIGSSPGPYPIRLAEGLYDRKW